MFEILKNPNFDFIGYRRIFMTISAVAVLASIVLLAVKGINRGIEFTGGAEVQIKYREAPDVGAIRSVLAPLTGATPVVTTIGSPENHEVVVKLGTAAAGTEDGEAEGDLIQKIIDALRSPEVKEKRQQGLVDLNVDDAAVVGATLAESPDIASSDAQALARAILSQRKDVAIFHTMEDLRAIEGMTPEALALLEQTAFLGPFSVRSQSYIGPVIGNELKRNSMLAIFGSLLGMLVYIWVRFELQWGFAAVVALAHDTIVTLGLFSVFGKEMSLPVVAAFLTLVGYSVNDTVVVFDRIRENIKTGGSRDFVALVNRSINQTLSRTIITTGSTWIVVLGLYLFGGQALNAFSFVLVIGVLVGTYSSISVASPIVVLWRAFAERRSRAVASPGRKAAAR